MTKIICYCLSLLLCVCLFVNVSLAQNKPLPSKPTIENPSAAASLSTTFDPPKAFNHIRSQVNFGPHWAGSPAIKEVRNYLTQELASYGLTVHQDAFMAQTPNPKFPTVEMVNLIAEIPGKKKDIVILASHYDTKWFPEEDFLGANDGGSSTGVLLELARVLAKSNPEYTLWLVFFDGEEAMNIEWQGTDHTYGSTHLLNKLRIEKKLSNIRAMVLLDMIGDKELNICRDESSTGWLKNIIYSTAEELGYQKSFPNETCDIEDDHTPFLRAGVAAVDIIDFDYGPDNDFWHTQEDSLDKISVESLKIVGNTVLNSLPKIFNYLNKTTK